MLKTRKLFFQTVTCIFILSVICVAFSSCQLISLLIRPPADTPPDDSELNEYRLSYRVCETALGVDPQTFCSNRGQGTALENGYTNATVTADNVLVLQLTDAQLDEWRNSNSSLQILQKMLGEEKQIVSKIIPQTGLIYGTLYEDADVACGFEISDDYSKVIAGPGDDKSYKLVIPRACFMMQLLAGTPSDEISVEYLEVNAEGIVTEHMFLPIYMYIFEDLNECKQLMSHEQALLEINEYHNPSVDENYSGLEYDAFWGMKYRSENIEYEIFAYEFADNDGALQYYTNVTGRTADSGKTRLGSKTYGWNGECRVVVVDGNKAYTLVSSASLIHKIEEMLSAVFSVQV